MLRCNEALVLVGTAISTEPRLKQSSGLSHSERTNTSLIEDQVNVVRGR